MKCRHCDSLLKHLLIDLGSMPPSNAYLTSEDLRKPEVSYPLRARLCDQCWLVQTEDYMTAEKLFTKDYAYFSSISTTWLAHAKTYANVIIERLNLNCTSFVIEIASNDGYLLKHFLSKDIPCLGIEPTNGTAEAAIRIGIPGIQEFFSEELSERLVSHNRKADLVIANNVLAHVPNINGFAKGLKTVLKDTGTITLEFPHLMNMIEKLQFDTIYHEHFSYLSLYFVNRLFSRIGLRIWDVEELTTHGGSLRIYACHKNDRRLTRQSVIDILEIEKMKGLQTVEPYLDFQRRAEELRNNLIKFLVKQKKYGKLVAAYGAAAKASTLLNYCGIKPDLVSFVCDANPSKQGSFLPGSRIPIYPPEHLKKMKPDYLLILPWNIALELKNYVSKFIDQHTKMLVVVPKLNYL